ncbi:MAG: YunC family protein [Kiritimatiellae bacterium]|nr:YunC family protein [Kiritimatiellia bacterium]
MEIQVDGKTFRGDCIDLAAGGRILLIQGRGGMLGCGYVSVAAADKFGHALATVSGVGNYAEMLDARVSGVSRAAAAKGVGPGMSGREALARLAE